MKKISVICVILAIVLLAVVPSVALAATVSQGTSGVCLINPIAITAIGDYVFVADDVDAGNNVILCFDISSDTPVYKYTYTTQRRIVNLSEADGKLCIIFQDGISVYEVSDTVFQTPYTTYGIENAADITFGKYTSDETTHDAMYVLSDEDLFYMYMDNQSQGFKHTDYDTRGISEMMACLYVDDVADNLLNGYVYCIWDRDIKRFNTQEGQWRIARDEFNSLGIWAPTLMIKGIFTYQADDEWQIALYDEDEINKLEYRPRSVNDKDYEYQAISNIDWDRNEDSMILDVCYTSGKIFVLDSNKQVEIYSYDSAKGMFVREAASIGTDIISFDIDLPSDFTGFFLAKSLGYPTNIVYKTTDQATSVENIISDNNEEFIILDFEGADDLPFYYVLIGNKFGWVKKSDGVETPDKDPKIKPVSTALNPSTPNLQYKAKFISANTVFIYDLPISDSSRTEIHQDITNPRDATVLQKFTEKKSDEIVEWYYISYEDDNGIERKGFIQRGLVGSFQPASDINEGDTYWEDKKVNSSLFNAVTLYTRSDMREGEEVHYNEEIIKLYSGTYVKVISVEGDAAYVQVKYRGITTCGWMPTDKLINRISMTTNATVGLSLLGVAIVVGITFAVILSKRKQRNASAIAEQQQPLQIDDISEE